MHYQYYQERLAQLELLYKNTVCAIEQKKLEELMLICELEMCLP